MNMNTYYSQSEFPSFPSPIKSTPAPQLNTEDDPFAPASDFAISPKTVTNTAPIVSKSAFDDLDDEFDGLEDAKEGSADDEFANISRSNLDDFNAVFDSSPPPSQAKSESTNVSNAFGVDSSYDFGTVSTASVGASQPAENATPIPASVTTAQSPQGSENHDWEAIFASLDEPSAITSKGIEAPKSPIQSQSSGRPSITPAARTLTEDGTHDDPILKNLTGMGYSRSVALNALEKYDYNLERVSLMAD
jgi:epidermal growth factor receptor substrate 15